MGRLGFFFNMNTCIGCGSCQVACKDMHDLQPGEFFRRVATLSIEKGEGKVYAHYSGACNHCEDAGCIKVCPTGAMHRAEDGTVVHSAGLCIGCGNCLWNCPNGAVSFSATKGTAQKCDGCAHLRAQGLQPRCCAACPTRSLEFGDVDELRKKHGVRDEDLSFLPVSDMGAPSLVVKTPYKISGGRHE